MMIEPLGYSPTLSNTFYAMMVGYLANLALPRLGEISRCGALNRAEKIPVEKLIGTVIVERVIDVICLAGCIVVASLVEYERIVLFLQTFIISPLKEKVQANSGVGNLVIAGSVILAILLLLVFLRSKLKPEGKFRKKLAELWIGLLEGLSSVSRMKNNILYLFLTVLMWTLYMFTAYVCFYSIEATSALGIRAGIFVLVAGGFGMSAPVQGGIGAYHFIVKEALTMFDIAPSDGLVYATVVHGSQTLFAIVLGFMSLLLLYLSRRKKEYGNNRTSADQSSK